MLLSQMNPEEDGVGSEERAGSGSGLCGLAVGEEAEWELGWPQAIPESNMESLSGGLLTWSDSQVRYLSSILR